MFFFTFEKYLFFYSPLQQKICGWVYFIKWGVLSCGRNMCFVLWVTLLPSCIYCKLLILHACIDIAECHCWCQLERCWCQLERVVLILCFMLWLICIFCCLLWILCFKLLIMVWELKDLISECCFCLTDIFGHIYTEVVCWIPKPAASIETSFTCWGVTYTRVTRMVEPWR